MPRLNYWHSPACMCRSPQLQFYTMDVLSTPQQPSSGQIAGAGAATGAQAESAADGACTSGTALPGLAEPSVFLYRLVAGHQTPSFGFYCAQVGELSIYSISRGILGARADSGLEMAASRAEMCRAKAPVTAPTVHLINNPACSMLALVLSTDVRCAGGRAVARP